MNVSAHFAADYAEARRKFLDAASAAGAHLSRFENSTRGPDGEELTTDVARLGPESAAKVLMTVSATHGGEGFCGSGIQVASFAAGFGRDLPPDTAVVVVHAINPYGFAWIRRVTEENVDLNRNFVRHDRPLPRNEAYDELHDAICPREWTDASLAASRARFDDYAKEHGAAALQRALSGGQYNHPDGVFFGGDAPTWARRTLEQIIGTEALGAKHLAIIDYHTGLGPWGHGEQIVIHAPSSAAEARAAQWYGKVTNPAAGTSSSAILHGTNLDGTETALAARGVAFTGMALEYGTLPLQVVLDAVRADNWLHQHGDVDSPKGRELKRAARDAFYGDKDDWKAMVFEQGYEAQRRALAGLQG